MPCMNTAGGYSTAGSPRATGGASSVARPAPACELQATAANTHTIRIRVTTQSSKALAGSLLLELGEPVERIERRHPIEVEGAELLEGGIRFGGQEESQLLRIRRGG